MKIPKQNHKLLFILIIITLFSLSLFSVSAELPPALQKIKDYNLALAGSNAIKITFAVAFLAGILGILSPCILPFLPAYFAYTFKEKKNITKMTLIFFCGFALVFVVMGIVAGFLGEQTISAIQNPIITRIAGLFLISMGILLFFGKGFSSFLTVQTKFSRDVPGTFLFGLAFALGWSACLGPILGGILAIGALLHNVYYAGLLLFFYALGNLVPLFILSFFYDKYNFGNSKWLNKPLHIGQRKIALSNFLSSLIFIIMGLIIFIFGGTAIFNTLDLIGTKSYFYSVQNQLLNSPNASLIGGITLILFIIVLIWVILRNKNK